MIIFKVIRFRNFFSYGSQFTELSLDRKTPLCITGQSGSGKSTLLDALSFVLYNKPHRNVNKNQLLNSINRKDCLVEIEFSTRGKDYLVRRGIKPNIFEIYRNNELIDQSSENKDYQKILEEDIIQMSLKTFNQVVIVSSTNYLPFMQLSASSRREFIEDVLDLGVFSLMKDDIKERATNVSSSIMSTNNDIELTKTKIEFFQKNEEDSKSDLRNQYQSMIDEKKSSIDELKSQYQVNESTIEELTQDIPEIDSGHLDTCKEKRQNIKTKNDAARKTIAWFEKTEVCPTCSQSIEHNHKQSILDDNKRILDKTDVILSKAELVILEEQQKYDGLVKAKRQIEQSITKYKTENESIKKQVFSIKKEIKSLEEKMNAPRKESGDDKVAELQKSIEILKDKKNDLLLNKDALDICKKMLGDDGIKESIIARYVPLMNQKINDYLDKLGLFVSFNLDSEFNEVIKSRARDNFSYSSFSMGERARIDIAILLMFREISKAKSRAVCNLLILDETFDSSLDSDGCNGLMDILENMDASIIAISHNNKLIDRFDDCIIVKKVDNYSIQEIIN